MIRGVLFDVGGVIIADNSLFVKQSIQKALAVDERTLTTMWSALVPLLGSGIIDETTFWQQAAKKYGIRPVTPGEDLFGKPFMRTLKPYPKVLAMARQLDGQNIRRAILSNTIETHAKILRKAGLYDDFDDILLSHEIGVRKPDVRAFELALNRMGLEAKDTILVDDREENIKAAQAYGIKTIRAIDEDQIVRDIQASVLD